MPSFKYLARTSIIAVKDEHRIVIGADSKVTLVGGPPDNIISSKIVQVGSTFFALSGLAYEPSTRFNAYSIAAKSCQEGGSILEKVERFESFVSARLVRTMEHVKEIKTEEYERSYGEECCLTIIFFGIENDAPVIYMSNFEKTDDNDGSPVPIHSRPAGAGPLFRSRCGRAAC